MEGKQLPPRTPHLAVQFEGWVKRRVDETAQCASGSRKLCVGLHSNLHILENLWGGVTAVYHRPASPYSYVWMGHLGLVREERGS